MKVPKKGMLCGWCGHPVIRHALAVEEFVPDTREGADPGRLKKQLFHKKRCWSKELRSRIDTERADARLVRSVELAKQALEEHGGPEGVGRGQMSEERLIELAVRDVGGQKPNLVSERARLITVGESTELPDGLIAAEDEDGQPSATFDLPIEEKRRKVPRGQLQLAVRTAIEARGAGWWTREQIREDVRQLGVETDNETMDASIYQYGKLEALESRSIGKRKLSEYRVRSLQVPEPLPPMLDKPSVKVERPQPIRHKDRPTFWEKLAEGAGKKEGTVVTFDRYETVPEPAIDVTPEPPNADVARALQRQEEFNEWCKLRAEEKAMTTANGHAKELFVLKSEKLLNDLERTMMQLVQETIKSAKEQISKLAEEELK